MSGVMRPHVKFWKGGDRTWCPFYLKGGPVDLFLNLPIPRPKQLHGSKRASIGLEDDGSLFLLMLRC